MKKYIVGDNYDDLKEFDSFKEALEFMNKYIEDSIPEMKRIYGVCGITYVYIKEIEFHIIGKPQRTRVDENTICTITRSNNDSERIVKEVHL